MFIFSLPNSFFLDYMSLRLNIKYSTITYANVHVYMFFPITGTWPKCCHKNFKYSADLKNHIIKTSHYQGLKILNLQATHV